MYEIQSSTIVNHSKRKGLKNSLRGLISVLVDLTMDNKKHNILFLPDSSSNYKLKFSKQHPGSKMFIEACYKANKNPDSLAINIRDNLGLQGQWQRYVDQL